MTAAGLKRFALLSGLDEEEREALADELEVQVIAGGRRLFEEGEPGRGLLLIDAGRVRVGSARGVSGSFGPGAALGSLSLVSHGPREIWAETLSRAQLLWLRPEGFERLVDACPRAACQLLRSILEEWSALAREGLEGWVGAPVDPRRDSH